MTDEFMGIVQLSDVAENKGILRKLDVKIEDGIFLVRRLTKKTSW
jgi:hypothetical protein